jgi:two-component system cell cycle response regulator CpdR
MHAGKMLLLVDDEAVIAAMLEDALREAGFDVRTVHDGATAVRALEENPEGFRALLTDIRLPINGPGGFDLAHRARELSPTIAVVYMSGASAVEWASKGVPKSVMLQKPFAIAQLVTAVASLLNELPI